MCCFLSENLLITFLCKLVICLLLTVSWLDSLHSKEVLTANVILGKFVVVPFKVKWLFSDKPLRIASGRQWWGDYISWQIKTFSTFQMILFVKANSLHLLWLVPQICAIRISLQSLVVWQLCHGFLVSSLNLICAVLVYYLWHCYRYRYCYLRLFIH